MAVNTTTQIGNLVGVEYKTSANGNSYIRARLAVNMGQEKESSWFNVVAFNELAQNTYETWMKSVENSSKNSVRAMVQGKIEVSNYGEGEEKKVSVTIIADEIGIATKYAVVTGLEPMSSGISTDKVQVQKASPEAIAAIPDVPTTHVSMMVQRMTIPEPDWLVNGGRTKVWLKSTIYDWAKNTGKLPIKSMMEVDIRKER